MTRVNYMEEVEKYMRRGNFVGVGEERLSSGDVWQRDIL
jgi:hypothetical protein